MPANPWFLKAQVQAEGEAIALSLAEAEAKAKAEADAKAEIDAQDRILQALLWIKRDAGSWGRVADWLETYIEDTKAYDEAQNAGSCGHSEGSDAKRTKTT